MFFHRAWPSLCFFPQSFLKSPYLNRNWATSTKLFQYCSITVVWIHNWRKVFSHNIRVGGPNIYFLFLKDFPESTLYCWDLIDSSSWSSWFAVYRTGLRVSLQTWAIKLAFQASTHMTRPTEWRPTKKESAQAWNINTHSHMPMHINASIYKYLHTCI